MNAEKKAEFVASLCNSVRDAVTERIKHMPETWDGIELREYLAREFAREAILSRYPRLDNKRLRNFNSDVATRFGL